MSPQETEVLTLQRLQLVNELEQHGIRDERVLDAIRSVPRHEFVPLPQRAHAYENRALAIGHDQTISQPYVVALMSELLCLRGSETVLEVGTGSGYQTAILTRLVHKVFTVERVLALHQSTGSRLRKLEYRVTTILGDGTKGLPEHAPYDAIIVTAASPRVPGALLDQLVDGGRLVIPIGGLKDQVLQRIVRQDKNFSVEEHAAVRFVPLVGEDGWKTGE